MKIGFFGTYFKTYARNSCFRTGLNQIGIPVIEVHEEVPKSNFDKASEFTLWASVKRVKTKLKTSFKLLSRAYELKSCDAILVLFPGHLDLPVAWIVAKWLRKPLIFDSFLSLYDSMITDKVMAQPNSIKTLVLKTVESLLLKLPDIILTDTRHMSAFLQTTFGVPKHKLMAIPLGTNDDLYFPNNLDKPLKKKINVFFFGLYNPLQGAPYIIRAAKLLKQDSSIHFTFLGDGVQKREITEFAQINQLDNVTFLPFSPEPELINHIHSCDIMLGIFANTTIAQRVIPNKNVAAAACGKALITGRHPAMEDFFSHMKNVYYCQPENPKSLANAILEVAKDVNLRQRLGSGSRVVFEQYFASPVLANQLIQCIKSQI